MSMLNPERVGPFPAGAVVYGNSAAVEDLLAAFAGTLKQRGWRVGGLIQRTRRNPAGRKLDMELIEADSGRRMSIAQSLGKGAGGDGCTVDPAAVAEATAVLRRAIGERSDLIVVNKFSHLERQHGGLADEMLAAMAEGIPLLTAVPAVMLEDWLAFCGGQCRLLPPQPEALWGWWGPHRLYRDLALGVAAVPAGRVVIGYNWVLVEGPDGVGLAQTPPRELPGCRLVPGGYGGRSLHDLAMLLTTSWNPFDTAVGMAAVNAHYNRFDLAGDSINGLDLLSGHDGRIVVVGGFPGVTERIPGALVIERNPDKGEYPDWAAETLLPGAEAALITASAAANRSLPRLLDLARGARVALVGPSATLSPRLFSYGAHSLSGLVVEDVDGIVKAVAEGATARPLKHYGRQVTIMRD